MSGARYDYYFIYAILYMIMGSALIGFHSTFGIVLIAISICYLVASYKNTNGWRATAKEETPLAYLPEPDTRPIISTAELNVRLETALGPDSGVSRLPPGLFEFLRDNDMSEHVVMMRNGQAKVVPISEAVSAIKASDKWIFERHKLRAPPSLDMP